jgi:hypothetical protein
MKNRDVQDVNIFFPTSMFPNIRITTSNNFGGKNMYRDLAYLKSAWCARWRSLEVEIPSSSAEKTAQEWKVNGGWVGEVGLHCPNSLFLILLLVPNYLSEAFFCGRSGCPCTNLWRKRRTTVLERQGLARENTSHLLNSVFNLAFSNTQIQCWAHLAFVLPTITISHIHSEITT